MFISLAKNHISNLNSMLVFKFILNHICVFFFFCRQALCAISNMADGPSCKGHIMGRTEDLQAMATFLVRWRLSFPQSSHHRVLSLHVRNTIKYGQAQRLLRTATEAGSLLIFQWGSPFSISPRKII